MEAAKGPAVSCDETLLQCVKNITLLSTAPASWKDAGELAPILAFLVGTIK